MESDTTQRLYYIFSFSRGCKVKDVSWILRIVNFHVPFNHRGKQRNAAFTDGLYLQSALNFLCPTEELIFLGHATFDADG